MHGRSSRIFETDAVQSVVPLTLWEALCFASKLHAMVEKEDAKEHLVPSDTEPQVGSQPVLPRDVFSNEFTFFLYFLVRSPFFWVSLVLFGTFLFFAITASSEGWTAICVLLSIFTGIASVVSFVLVARQLSDVEVSRGFELEQSVQFLFEVRDVKPGMRTVKWDIVASRMNDYLFETKYYPHRYAFYDGKSCLDGFKKVYLLPREEAFDAARLSDSAHGGNSAYSYFKRQVSKEYYESVDEQVTEVCEERSESRCAEV